jgi:transcriptional regulator with XRE-family HTH domain
MRESLPDLLRERKLSVRAMATAAGISEGHLSNVLKGNKRPSPKLARSIARELGLQDDYFPEVREAAVIKAIRTDAKLRDRVYTAQRRQS